MRKVVTIVGARPQFIKAAPVSRAMETSGKLREVILHTGQHFDDNMSRIFFSELGLAVPAHNLGIHGGSHGEMTGRMLEGTEAFLQREAPDMVVVYGDTNSTLAGALAAVKLGVPVAHVEAGLRSFNRSMPEEINRIAVDHVSDLLLCPTEAAVEQLRREGIGHVIRDGALCETGPYAANSVSVAAPVAAWTGDVMYDALLIFRERARGQSAVLERLGLIERGYVAVTLHRAENTTDPKGLSHLARELIDLSRKIPVVFPAHPRTRDALRRAGMADALGSASGMRLTEPLSYLDFLRLEEAARVVVTDSGGVQKEAMFLQVPCVTLRNETEWQETIQSGWNRLAGSRPSRLAEYVAEATAPKQSDCAAFGRGRAAQAVVALLEARLGT